MAPQDTHHTIQFTLHRHLSQVQAGIFALAQRLRTVPSMLMLFPFLLAGLATPQWDYAGTIPDAPRVFYILHSGLSDTPNYAAHGVESALIQAGVPASQIIILDNPFVEFLPAGDPNQGDGLHWVSQLSVNALQNVSSYLESAMPNSNIVQNQYRAMQRELKAHGFRPGQDKLVWIGHSAGGQMGLTMAAMLAKDNHNAVSISKIIMLGSPVYQNNAPHPVRIISIISPDDWVLQGTSRIRKLFQIPPNLDDNDKVIRMKGLGHSDYYINPEALKRIITEATSKDILQTHV